MLVFGKFNVNSHYSQYKEQCDFLLRAACHSLSVMKNPQIEHKVPVANAFNDAFAQLAAASDYKNFFSFVNAFVSSSHNTGLDRYASLFSNLHSHGFDLESWLQNVNKYLFQVLNNAHFLMDDAQQTIQKEIFLHLTCTLLFFVNVEAQRSDSMKKPWQFSQCQCFLNKCIDLRLFRNGDKQYTKCFNLLKEFLECLGTGAENGAFADSMAKFLNNTLK